MTMTSTQAHETFKQMVRQGQIRHGNFVDSIASQTRSLSERQLACVLDIIAKAQAPQVKPAPAAQITLQGILDLFAQGVAAGLKKPSFLLKLVSGKIVKLNPYKDCIYINVPDSESLGYIAADGSVNFYRAATEADRVDTVGLLTEFANDPAGVGARIGKMTSHCCFCSLELTTDESKDAGYGPKCAKNYNLPWGKKTRKAA